MDNDPIECFVCEYPAGDRLIKIEQKDYGYVWGELRGDGDIYLCSVCHASHTGELIRKPLHAITSTETQMILTAISTATNLILDAIARKP